MFLSKYAAHLVMLAAALSLAGCQHTPPQMPPMDHSTMEGKMLYRHDKQHQHMIMMAQACEGRALGDATMLQTPQGELKGQCQLMFVPDQPAAQQRSQP